MEIPLPTSEQIAQINSQREELALLMRRQADSPLIVLMGPCAADNNRHPNGDSATVNHIQMMAQTAQGVKGLKFFGRLNGVKPRTRGGTTGLIHQANGAHVYAKSARELTDKDVPLVAEVMDESDAAVAQPWLTGQWIGARNVQDTGVRQLMRPTQNELDAGIVPAPVFVKHNTDGDLTTAIDALHAIRSSELTTRLRFTNAGLREVTTCPNLNTGLILRGFMPRPEGSLEDILAAEITRARTLTEEEFGPNTIPIVVDISHGHAKWEGGGEAGQLAVARALGRIMSSGVRIDGVMAETYLLPGNQPNNGLIPGLSQVDACIGESEAVLLLKTLGSYSSGA